MAKEDTLAPAGNLKEDLNTVADFLPNDPIAAIDLLDTRAQRHGICRTFNDGRIGRGCTVNMGEYGAKHFAGKLGIPKKVPNDLEKCWNNVVKSVCNHASPCFGNVKPVTDTTTGTSTVKTTRLEHEFMFFTIFGESWNMTQCEMDFGVHVAECPDCCSCKGMIQYKTVTRLRPEKQKGCEAW